MPKIQTFTTRADTIYGVSFIVLAPEHPEVTSLTKPERLVEVEQYLKTTKAKSERERQIGKEKTGVFTGSYAIHPLTGEQIPIWIADYVLYGYGTGAIMAVPAHDERDFEFATKYNLPIKQVIKSKTEDIASSLESAFVSKEGVLFNSDLINGLEVSEAITKISDHLEKKKLGKREINYKFRDWVFSRQRYWGEPFPFVYEKVAD